MDIHPRDGLLSPRQARAEGVLPAGILPRSRAIRFAGLSNFAQLIDSEADASGHTTDGATRSWGPAPMLSKNACRYLDSGTEQSNVLSSNLSKDRERWCDVVISRAV